MIAAVTSTPAWALWLAFSLSILGILMWLFVVIAVRKLIAQYKAQYGPLLSALLGPSTVNSNSGGTVTQVAQDVMHGEQAP